MAASCGYTIHQYPAFIRGPIWSHFQSTHLRHYFSFFVKNHFFYHLFRVYTVVFHLQNGTKTVSFWGQKNSENTLRIQSCYYTSLQKSSIVASIFSMGKKTAETCSRLGRTVSDALLCHTAPETLHLCCCFVQQSEPVMLAPSATAADFPECSFADRISLCLRRCEMWPDSQQRMRRNPPICC